MKHASMTLHQPTAISLREAVPEDLSAIILLLRQLWPGKEISAASLQDAFMKSFSLEGHIIRVAVYEDRVVGVCSISIRNNLKAEGNLANVDELVVDESMRGREIGKFLMQDAEDIASAAGCKILGLESSFHRTEAHRFYEDNGYWKQGYYITRELE